MSDEWDMEEALAWVIWRDVRAVEQVRLVGLVTLNFYPPDVPGRGTIPFDNNPIPRHGNYKNLVSALRGGQITARARANGVGDRVEITPSQWRDLTINTSVYRGTQAIPEDGANKGTIWDDLKLSIAEVMGLFPAPGGRRRSNTKSIGDGQIDDDAEIAMMHSLITTTKCSTLSAAKQAALTARGAGTIEAKVRRLTRKYRRKYPK